MAILLAVQAFCGLFLINPVGQHINRHTHEWWDNGTLLSRMRHFGVYVFFVSLLGGLAIIFLLEHSSRFEMLLALATILLAVNAGTWSATFIFMLNMLGFRTWAVFLAIIAILLGLLASIILVQWFHGAASWLLGQMLGALVGALWARHVLYSRVRKVEGTSSMATLLDRNVVLAYCLPLAISTGFMWVQTSGYRFMVGHHWGLDALGFLAVGLLLASQIWALVETLVQQFLLPLFFRRITGTDESSHIVAMSDLLNLVGPIYLVLAGAMFVGASSIVALLTTSQFADATLFLCFGICIELCRVLGNLAGQAAQITKNTRSLWFPYFLGALVVVAGIGGAGFLDNEIVWVGYVLSAAALMTLLAMARAMYRQVAFSLNGRRWLQGSMVMLLLAMQVVWLGKPYDMLSALIVVLLTALVSVLAVYFMSRNEPALRRFLVVDLRGSNS